MRRLFSSPYCKNKESFEKKFAAIDQLDLKLYFIYNFIRFTNNVQNILHNILEQFRGKLLMVIQNKSGNKKLG